MTVVEVVASALRDGATVALVGARDAPSDALGIFHRLAAYAVRRGATVVTGGAEGVDQAAIDGACSVNPSSVLVYLPWPRFGHPLHPDVRRVVNIVTERQQAIVREALPHARNLRAGALSLHCRNVAIMDVASVCVAWPSRVTSGTVGAVAIARLLGKPVVDISVPETLDALRRELRR